MCWRSNVSLEQEMTRLLSSSPQRHPKARPARGVPTKSPPAAAGQELSAAPEKPKVVRYLLVFLLGFAAALIWTTERQKQPPRSWSSAHQRRLQELMSLDFAALSGGTAFVGDSLTENLDLNHYFVPGQRLVNMGIQGDTCGGIGPLGCIERLDFGIIQARPARLVLLIGINDLAFTRYEDPLGSKLDRYEALEVRLRKRMPQCKLFLVSLLPTRAEHAYLRPEILVFNQQIRRLAERDHQVYVDAHRMLRDQEDLLNPSYSLDGMHLNPTGYQVLAQVYASALGLHLNPSAAP